MPARVDINTESEHLYKHPQYNLVILNSSDADRLHSLSGEYDGIENVPETEEVNCIVLRYIREVDCYVKDGGMNTTVKICDLDYTWLKLN